MEHISKDIIIRNSILKFYCIVLQFLKYEKKEYNAQHNANFWIVLCCLVGPKLLLDFIILKIAVTR